MTSYATARRIAEPFSTPGFRSLWTAAVLAATAQWIDRVAVGWYIFHVTQSAFLTSAAVSVQMGPGFFIGPFAGAVADSSPRPKILATAIGIRSCTIAAMALLVHGGVSHVALIFTVIAIGGTGQAMQFACQQTLSGDLVGPERRAQAISLVSMGQRAVAAVAAVGSGVIIGTLGPTFALGIAACATSLAAFSYLRIEEPSARHGRARLSLLRDTLHGLRTVGRVPLVAILLGLMVVVEVFGYSYYALIPAVADRIAHVGPTGLGGLSAAPALGGIVGLLFLAAYADRIRLGVVFLTVFGTFGAMMVVIGAAPWYVVSLIAAAGIGCSAAMIDALEWIMLQQSVEDGLRGRVLGAWNVAIGFGWIVGPLTLGALADATSVTFAFALAGTIVLVTCAIGATVFPRLRAV